MFQKLSIALALLLGINCAVAQEEGAVRLAGQGADSSQGRLEIYHGGQWGTVCDDGFESVDASIVCIQLGFPAALASVVTNTFGPGRGVIWLDDVACSGTETTLSQCPHKGWNTADCGHNEDIAVKCGTSASSARLRTAPGIPTAAKLLNVNRKVIVSTTPDSRIRIIGPSNLPATGVVQIYNDTIDQWGGVCDDGWDFNDARVVCRSLCYDQAKALPGSVAFDISNITEPMTISGMRCDGTESSIVDCTKDRPWVDGGGACTPSEKARVTYEEIDHSPPARQEPVMNCTDGRISASFSTITDPHLEPKHLSVNVSYTGACSEEKTNSTDFITISVPFDECGTQATANSTHIIYKTKIRYLPTYSSGVVSHSNTYIFKIQCELPRVLNASKPILPGSETISQSAPGNFDISLSFFKDPLFANRETDYPLEIPLGAKLGGLVALMVVDENTKLVVPDCYATPTSARQHPTNYSLWTDKCIDDPTVGFFDFNASTFGWRYQTFKFVNYPEVHIHCEALVCLTNVDGPECDRSCLKTTTATTSTTAGGTTSLASGGRRRRSVDHERVHLSSPTIIVYNPNQDGSVITRGEDRC